MLKALLTKSKKNQKGFTLIELLAVIVILAILAAIAIPSVMHIIQNQNNKAEVQDALTVINAAKMYVADTNTQGAGSATADQLAPYISKAGSLKTSDSSYTVSWTTDNEYTVSGLTLPTGAGSSESDLIQYNQGGSK